MGRRRGRVARIGGGSDAGGPGVRAFFDEQRPGPGRLLLAGVALLLVVETIVANRGWRATASVVVPAPPERSIS